MHHPGMRMISILAQEYDQFITLIQLITLLINQYIILTIRLTQLYPA